MSVDLLFDVPTDYARELISTKKEGTGYKIIDGVVKGRSTSIWFTNLEHKKRNEELILTGKEKHLNLRSFSKNQKIEAHERQDGICPGL